MKQILVAVVMIIPAVLPAAWGAEAPRLPVAVMTDLPVVERTPYTENADATAAVDAAFTRAKKSGKRVLIDLGGNWCGDCIVLANIMALKEMRPFLAAHFEMVSVDVGRFDKNLQIPARFGITKRLEGVPAVIVAEADGKFVNPGKITALSDARHMTPQAVADWLGQWAK